MEIYSGTYKKQDGEERFTEFIPLVRNKDTFEGIDLTKLTADEREKAIEVVKDFDTRIKPFMKAYRKFIHTSFKGEIGIQTLT